MMLSASLLMVITTNMVGFGHDSKNIVDLAAASPDLSTLVGALEAAGLDTTLQSSGPFTVFAPSNEAFAKLDPEYLKALLQKTNVKTLQALLLYHVSLGEAFSKDLKNGQLIKTVEGLAVNVSITKKLFNKPTVKIDDATVTKADVAASNGVVHIIDTVLDPADLPPLPTGPQNIVQLAQANPDLSTLVTALTAAGLVDALSGAGPFTVFAPSNEAFDALPSGVLANLLKPRNKNQLVKLLEYHVLGKAIKSTDVGKGASASATALEGDTVEVFRACTARGCSRASRVFINPLQNVSQCGYQQYSACYEAQVTSKDNVASNGVVHIVNSVLNIPDHLYFRSVNTNNQCGQVDAAPRIPTALFGPSNSAELQRYIDITIKLYGPQKLELGMCKDLDYTKNLGGRSSAAWTSPELMGPICKLQCGCAYPDCPDQPDDPAAGKFCSLCGPRFNQYAAISLFGYCPPGSVC